MRRIFNEDKKRIEVVLWCLKKKTINTVALPPENCIVQKEVLLDFFGFMIRLPIQ